MRFYLYPALAILTGSTIAAALPPLVDGSTPQTLITSLYAHFRNGGIPDIDATNSDSVLSPEFSALEKRHDQQIQAGQVKDAMGEDGNDFCGCQDTNHPTWTVHIDSITGDHATATGVWRDKGYATVVTRFSFIHTPKGWRISDYKTGNDPSSRFREMKEQVSHDANVKPHTYDN